MRTSMPRSPRHLTLATAAKPAKLPRNVWKDRSTSFFSPAPYFFSALNQVLNLAGGAAVWINPPISPFLKGGLRGI